MVTLMWKWLSVSSPDAAAVRSATGMKSTLLHPPRCRSSYGQTPHDPVAGGGWDSSAAGSALLPLQPWHVMIDPELCICHSSRFTFCCYRLGAAGGVHNGEAVAHHLPGLKERIGDITHSEGQLRRVSVAWQAELPAKQTLNNPRQQGRYVTINVCDWKSLTRSGLLLQTLDLYSPPNLWLGWQSPAEHPLSRRGTAEGAHRSALTATAHLRILSNHHDHLCLLTSDPQEAATPARGDLLTDCALAGFLC